MHALCQVGSAALLASSCCPPIQFLELQAQQGKLFLTADETTITYIRGNLAEANKRV